MTAEAAIVALAGNNRAAAKVCRDLYHYAPKIDPGDFIEGWGPLRDLDALGVWGDRIVKLHAVCGEDLVTMLAVLLAWQLGVDDSINPTAIGRAIDRGESLDLDAALRAVRTELPEFNAVV